MRFQSGRQHIGALGVVAAVVTGTRFAFGIGLHQKAAKIGNNFVDFVRLGVPPGLYRRIKRIGSFQTAQFDGGGPACRQIDLDTVGPEDFGYGFGLLQIGSGQTIGLGVDIVEHHAIDADRCLGAGIIGQARIDEIGQPPPVEDRGAGIAALDRAIEIIPVVDDAELDFRGVFNC